MIEIRQGHGQHLAYDAPSMLLDAGTGRIRGIADARRRPAARCMACTGASPAPACAGCSARLPDGGLRHNGTENRHKPISTQPVQGVHCAQDRRRVETIFKGLPLCTGDRSDVLIPQFLTGGHCRAVWTRTGIRTALSSITIPYTKR
ncbi:hypothetical protein [Xanthomonas theicola]|uniref:hypothetical protein n=1 Tax=Xanthomonas theicola TaxID=56464 RepID=UPI0013048009|nr:hypothetical protein [Xanthomonas theicola]QNH24541.1 hypothetical protein G4Q83_06965 [Xanthomonas theicola]